jgi:copper chaperone
MQITIEVENIRCGGCANSITQKLMEDERIDNISIDIEKQLVSFDTADEDTDAVRTAASKQLLSLGYPEKGSVEGLEALKGKAKSVVSCAVGKMT